MEDRAKGRVGGFLLGVKGFYKPRRGHIYGTIIIVISQS